MIKRPGGEGRYYHGHETAHFCFSDFGLQRTDTVIYHTEKRLSSCAFFMRHLPLPSGLRGTGSAGLSLCGSAGFASAFLFFATAEVKACSKK